ncbi:bile acid:sodium symporter [Altererythrobacter arenosus]|uniref:Bile acid:sodium symporter n=1 Tax=Altererythrobacter arenosus TaxID=3032592 RepID=A0ABY8FPY6_9SPHN|nr:bile acid:sodium symporter family protein [Altererythrobacter sp. CAU 1644]WFL76907.1 bile acid:sodium symporter [Altererythrobacter sp. CAU 1644]
MRRTLSMFADPMITVLAIATLGAIAFPAVGEAREVARDISNIGIFALFLVNGIRIARGEILRGFANWRFFLPLFLFVFLVMPLGGLAVSRLAEGILPPLVALGFLYLGTLPSTIQSATSYTSLAGGNIALSVVGAALINIAGVFVTAPLFAVLGGGEVGELGNEAIVRIGLILLLPFVLGQLFQGWTRDWIVAHKSQVVWLDRIVIGIAVYVAFSGAVEQGLGEMFDAQGWAVLIALVTGMLLLANIGAWLASGAMRFAREDRIAFLFAGAQKSVAIGAPLAAILFAPEVGGFVIAPLLLYHLFQLVLAAPVANRLARASD